MLSNEGLQRTRSLKLKEEYTELKTQCEITRAY